jgi:AraC-like DNA-binding protein
MMQEQNGHQDGGIILYWAHKGTHPPEIRRTSRLANWVLGLGVSGQCIYRDTHGGQATFAPGQIVLIRADAQQDWRVPSGRGKRGANGWGYLAFIFAPDALWTRRLNYPDTIGGHIVLSPGAKALARIRPRLEEAVKWFDSSSIHRLELARCAFEMGLLHMHESMGNLTTPQDARVQQAMGFIAESLSRPVTVADVAQAAACSPSHLNWLFRRDLGQSIHWHLQQARMDRAAYLLMHSTLSIKEIADAVGFENPKYFMNCFKRCYGLTAADYRRAKRSV